MEDEQKRERGRPTKCTPDLMRAICETLVVEQRVPKVCAGLNISVESYYRYLAGSQVKPENYQFEWSPEIGTMAFHEGVLLAGKMSIATLVSSTVHRAMSGYEEQVLFRGEQMWRKRADLPPDWDKRVKDLDDEQRMLLYGCVDNFERAIDPATGKLELVPLTVVRQPAPELISRVLESLGPETFRRKSDLNVTVTKSPGVTRLGTNPTPPPVVQQIEQQPVDDAMLKYVPKHIADSASEEEHADRDDLVDSADAARVRHNRVAPGGFRVS